MTWFGSCDWRVLGFGVLRCSVLLTLLVVASAATADDRYTAASIAAELEAVDDGGLTLTIKRVFPREYQSNLEEMARLANEGAPPGVYRRRGAEQSMQLRRANAHFLTAASDKKVSAIFRAELSITENLSHDLTLCSEYAVAGGGAFAARDDIATFLPLLGAKGAALFEAIDNGRRASPKPVVEATDRHWTALIEHWRTSGATDAEIDIFFSQDVANPEMCRVYLSFLNALITMPDETGSEMRRLLAISEAQS